MLSTLMHKDEANRQIRPMQAVVAIVAIGGPSCAGKSTLVHALQAYWGTENTSILPIDAYYRDHSHVPMEERLKRNLDAPEALEWPLLTAHLEALAAGETVACPVYDYATHTRRREEAALSPGPVLIVEGLFALWSEAIRRLAAVCVYVDLPLDRCLDRRIARDAAERDRTEEQTREQYVRFVQPMAEMHVLPTKALADVVVSGDEPSAEAAARVVAFIEQKRALR